MTFEDWWTQERIDEFTEGSGAPGASYAERLARFAFNAGLAARTPATTAGSATSNITLRELAESVCADNDCICDIEDESGDAQSMSDVDGCANCPCAGDDCLRCAAEMALANDGASPATTGEAAVVPQAGERVPPEKGDVWVWVARKGPLGREYVFTGDTTLGGRLYSVAGGGGFTERDLRGGELTFVRRGEPTTRTTRPVCADCGGLTEMIGSALCETCKEKRGLIGGPVTERTPKEDDRG